jgi:hypothetical protein
MLIVAHPGHELRLFGWLQRARPVVQVLTNGAGRDGVSRAPASLDILRAAGATPGAIFGELSDRDVYEALLNGRTELFTGLLERLTCEAIACGAQVLIGDAAEGYNPTHDLCRALIDAAAALVERRTGRRPANLAFDLSEWSGEGVRGDGETVELALDAPTHAAKMAACYAYPGLSAEVEQAVAAVGEEFFQRERIRLTPQGQALPAGPDYEATGAARVAAGAYDQAIGYAAHVAPMERALRRYAQVA